MGFPATIKAEVKVTTGAVIQVARRELDALRSSDPSSCGILAALYWPGDRKIGGCWIVVDAATAFGRQSGPTVSVRLVALARAARQQPWLDDLRAHVDARWPSMLQAFLEDALASHGQLIDRLRQCHEEGSLREQLPTHDVLEHDHKKALEKLFDALGEAEAGRVLQDLFAYLLGLAGYRSITSNPVGVPDFVATELEAQVSEDRRVSIVVTREEAGRIAACCQRAGEAVLAAKVLSAAEEKETGSQGTSPPQATRE
jgi:hypothetical protein